MKNFLLIIPFLLLCFLTHSQQVPNLNKFKTHKEKLQVLTDYCDGVLAKNDYKNLRIASEKGMSIVLKKDYYNRSLFLFYIGVSYDYALENKLATYNLEQSEFYARKAKNEFRIRESLRQLLIAYNNVGQQDKRKRVLNELLEIINTSSDLKIKSDLQGDVADYYVTTGKYEQGLYYLLENLTYRKNHLKNANLNDSINYGVKLVNIAELYLETKKTSKVISYLQQSEPFLKKYPAGIAHIYKDYVDVYLQVNQIEKAKYNYVKLILYLKSTTDIALFEELIASDLVFSEYYLLKKNISEANVYINHARKIVIKYPVSYLEGSINYMQGRILLESKEYKKALYYLKLAEPIIQDDIPERKSTLQLELSKTYAGLAEWELAYTYQKRYAESQKALLTEKAKKNFFAMEEKYQNKEKQQKIKFLFEENKLKKTEIKSVKTQRGLFIISIISLIVFTFLVYRQSRLRKQTNTELLFLNQELDKSNKVKARFFSILNHDLRSPVANLIHFLHLQKNNPELLTEESKLRMENKTISAAENLLESMEDILLWSKDQMEQFKPNKSKLVISELFEDLRKHFASEEHAEIRFKNSQDLVLNTDINYLKTIARNLTANALTVLKNVEEPHVIWEAWSENNAVYLSISDNGSGSTKENFNALYDDSEVIGINTGLGLHLIRDLAKTINCTIQVDQNTTSGTTFILKFEE